MRAPPPTLRAMATTWHDLAFSLAARVGARLPPPPVRV